MTSPILDLAIILIFTYLLLSIISSTIYEAFLTMKKARGKMLKHAMKTLFFDDEWRARTSELLIESSTIKALKKTDVSFPAYIPSASFTTAIIGLIRDGSTERVTIDFIREKLNSDTCVIKGDARMALLNILDTAQDDYVKFLDGLNKFYDDYMDRVSGWFKLKYQKFMFIISLVVTLVLNVDSVHIATSLWKDPQKMSAAAGMISEEVNNMSLSEDRASITYRNVNGRDMTVNVVNHNDTAEISADSAMAILRAQQADVKELLSKVESTGIPMGWESTQAIKDVFQWKPSLAVKIAGWLITALAVFMGAPAWFDILSKLVNLRGAGKKPKEAAEGTGS